MARGQAGKADKQLNLTNTTAAGYGTAAAGLGSQLTGEAGKLLASTGYDPGTLSAITNAGMGAVNSAFGSAGDEISRKAATSGNPASVGALEDLLARDKGLAAGKEAGDIEIQNANFKEAQRAQGRQILSGLFGTDVGAQTGLLGLGPATLGARAAGGGWSQGFKDVLTGVGSLGKGGGG